MSGLVNVIVAFSREEDARKIKGVLMRHGIHVAAVCVSGSKILAAAENLGSGLIVCGFRFPDATYQEIRDALTEKFDMLLIASPAHWEGEDREGIMCLPLPLMSQDLVNTVFLMCRMLEEKLRNHKRQRTPRSEEDRKVIEKAKILLMERNQMSEEAAHRYLQTCSMDGGRAMAETAQMVLKLYM